MKVILQLQMYYDNYTKTQLQILLRLTQVTLTACPHPQLSERDNTDHKQKKYDSLFMTHITSDFRRFAEIENKEFLAVVEAIEAIF